MTDPLSEWKCLSRRQELLEQAARLQRATVVVRLHKLEHNKLALFSASAVELYKKLYHPSVWALGLSVMRWLWHKKR